jgi:hypothetical protein
MSDSPDLARYRAFMRHPRYRSRRWLTHQSELYEQLTPAEKTAARFIEFEAGERYKIRARILFFVCAVLVFTFVIATIITI